VQRTTGIAHLNRRDSLQFWRLTSMRLTPKALTHVSRIDTFQETIGGLAQLGERQAGSLKVTGSSPVSSIIMLQNKPRIDGAFSLRCTENTGRAPSIRPRNFLAPFTAA
jgi:hypothetical protein